MGGTQKSFRFWVSYWDVAQELPQKQRGEFYEAIVDYMFTDTDPEPRLKGTTKLAFKAIKANLNTSKKRSQSGTNGSKARWSCDNGTEWQTDSKKIANGSQIKTKNEIENKTKSNCDSETLEQGIPEKHRAQLVELGVLHAK